MESYKEALEEAQAWSRVYGCKVQIFAVPVRWAVGGHGWVYRWRGVTR